ncbi:phosphonate C-P lyase system protein PhnL [Thorsellia anophelis]|uniref:Alpha-D-ribose 1-methylphosphonate 5-triphosphate synthase subunit PhnL n=1 Tax=Thorsellia anophelis DSM 18579 TaxID=1123402 RepID=A0A1I0ASH2_9GAMM|nr:phosphonate C-P lyase system protein PhnL [Thorsellia anophelis]SES96873.1 alpha-D-ribose 1-methylphosphonate 5-triphosphate synthase subunit PhnL [Thorsellia anophelis DSM 18579]
MNIAIEVKNVGKTFILHNQQSAKIPVLGGINLSVNYGECVVLDGHSGSGKSTLLRSLFANYQPDEGEIIIHHQGMQTELISASPRAIIELRRTTIGWVSQFLRVIPRVSAIDIVMQPLLEIGADMQVARDKAANLLTQLNVPERLWSLAPSTFSGGEQQRVNIARGFIVDYPILLLDEPTASLDSKNAEVVINLINQAKARGAAIIGIFHDTQTRDQVATRLFSMQKSAH